MSGAASRGRAERYRVANKVNTSLLLVITGLDRGGAESQVLELARGHVRRGRPVAVASLLPGGELAPAFAASGIPVADLGMRRGMPDPRAAWRLARLVKQRAPAIVHAHMVHANLLSRAARLIVPQQLLVNTAHSVHEGGRARELAYRATAPCCDVMTNVSAGATERYRHLHLAPELLHVPNGLDPAPFESARHLRAATRGALGIGEGQWAWLAVGRLEPPKDPLTLVEAFVRCGTPQEALFLAGSGSLADETIRAIAAAGAGDRIRLLGSRGDVPALLAAADGVVLSSSWEGHPMVVLEAAASGKPVVATGAPGITELVRDGVTGLLARPGDVDDLGAAMNHLRSLPASDRLALVERARQLLDERYTLDAILDAWDALYARHLSASPGRLRA